MLTVLDFIGQHRKEFRFEEQFRALTNLTRKRLLSSVEQGFPQLPSGCQIILEPKAKELIIDNIRNQLSVNVAQLAQEVRRDGVSDLTAYLRESGRELKEIYRSNGGSWTGLLRRSGLLSEEIPQGEEALLKRVTAFQHADDPERIRAYSDLLADDAPRYSLLSERDQAFARMLYFSLWPLSGFSSFEEGLESLRPHPAVRSEIRQVLAHVLDRLDHVPIKLAGPLESLPLTVHASYSREEILPALGQAFVDRDLPGHFREGVKWCEGISTDALFITLEKDEKDFSPQTRYRDFALNELRFHWESQNRTSETSATGRRYQSHQADGSHVLLFVRRYKKTDIGGPQPWLLLGPAEYVSHEGSKPMGIVWDLQHEMPADVWTYSTITNG